MTRPTIAVVIPARGATLTIDRALTSIGDAHPFTIEVVIVDDGPDDGIRLAVKHSDRRHVLVIPGPDRGAGAGRNAGAAVTTAPLLAFLDADDEALPGWLEGFVEAAESADFVCRPMIVRTPGLADELISPRPLGPAFGPRPLCLLAGAWAVSRRLWEAAGGYDEGVQFGENTELGLRLARTAAARGWTLTAIDDPGAVWHRPLLRRPKPSAVRSGAEALLVRHPWVERQDPVLARDHHTVAGVAALRQGDARNARRHLARSWRLAPRDLRCFLRVVAALSGPTRALAWPDRRAPGGDADVSTAPDGTLTSVIIPSHDAAATLEGTLRSVAAAVAPQGGVEVIVVDDASTDATVAIAEGFGTELAITVVTASAGTAGGARNIGAAASRGGYLLFVDADDEIDGDFLVAMVAALDGADLVAPRLDVESLNPGWERWSRQPPQTSGLGSGFFPFAYAAGLGIRREAFSRLRGFDGGMAGAEDVDLCWRAVASGLHLVFVPDAVVRYRFRAGWRGVVGQAFDYGIAGAALQARWAAYGSPRRPAMEVVRQWGGILRAFGRARDRRDVARAAYLAANHLGRLVGSLRSRTLAL